MATLGPMRRYTPPLLSFLILFICTGSSMLLHSNPTYAADEIDYRADPAAPIWVHDWSVESLTNILDWGIWPLHFVNTRAFVIDEDTRAPDLDALSSDCRALTDVIVLGIRYRWDNAKAAHGDTFETIYAHSTDPASLNIYQSSGGAVTLHWETDARRYVLIHGNTWNDRSTFTDFISDYKVLRKGPGESEFTQYGPFSFTGGSAEWTDNGMTAAGQYTYKIVSEIEPGLFASFSNEQTIDFTPGVPDSRAFWVNEIWGDHPNPDDDAFGTHILHISLSAYTGSPTSPDLACDIQHPRRDMIGWDAEKTALTHVGYGDGVHDFDLTYQWTESTEYFEDCMGAFVCRFFENTSGNPANPVWEPIFEGDSFTTAPNNRIRSIYWYTYLTDVTESESVTAFALRAEEVLAPPGAIGEYDGVFGDTADDGVLGYWGDMPHDYNTTVYPQQVADFLHDIRQTDRMSGKALIVNGIEKTTSPKYEEVDGVVYERFISHRGDYCVEDGDTHVGNDIATDGDIWSGGRWLCNMSYFMSIYDTPGLEAYAWPYYEEGNTRARLFTYASFLIGAAAGEAMDRSFYAPIQYRDPSTDDDHLQVFAEQMLGLGNVELPLPIIPPPGDCSDTPTKDLEKDIQGNPCDETEPGDCTSFFTQDLVEGYFEHGIVLVNYNHWCQGVRADLEFTLPAGETYYRLYIDEHQLFDGGRFWTEPVSGTIEVHALTAEFLMKDPIASPTVATANSHPIYLDIPSSCRLSLEASQWDGQPLWIEVDTAPLNTSLTDNVPLLDGDGDGFYESDELDVTVLPGNYQLSYYARGADGLGLYGSFEVVVDERDAYYVNKSDEPELGLDYSGIPYSSVIFDYDGDGDGDLLISQKGENAQLYEMLDLATTGIPRFRNQSVNEFGSDRPGPGCRGIAPADINNDGREDIFIAHADAGMLYVRVWDEGLSRWVYDDHAGDLGIASYISDTWSGSWADYDLDNDLDLYVTRADAVGPDFQDPHYDNLVPLQDYLLRNDLSTSAGFSERSQDMEGLAGSANMSVAAAWADIDLDGDQDLFVPSLDQLYPGQEYARLYVNKGDGTFTEEFTDRFGSPSLIMASGACWSDVDGDGDLDLVCSIQNPIQTPRCVFINDDGIFTSSDIPVSIASNGVTPLDYNLDGAVDLLFTPRETDDSPRLLRNVNTGSTLYMDDTVNSGLYSLGRVDGVAVNDYGHDGDPDLFLGRHRSSSAFFYRASGGETMDDPINNFVAIRLIPQGGNNESCIGTRVVAASPDGTVVQVVDGGSGRGGQQPRILVFGVGDNTGPIAVDVYWPGGYHQSGAVPVGQVSDVSDQTTPGVVEGSLGVQMSLLPDDRIRWTCTWESLYSSAPMSDGVLMTKPDQSVEFVEATWSGVDHKYQHMTGGGYQHQLIFAMDCEPGTYAFRSFSGTNISSSWSGLVHKTFRFCPAGN